MNRLTMALGLTTALAIAGQAQAQDSFPNNTIEVVTHAGAGGGTDTNARMMMRSVAPLLGADMVVVNRVGGAGAASMEYVAGRPADGHTILVWTTGHAVAQATAGDDGAAGLIPIARGTNDPQILMTRCGVYEDAQAFLDAQSETPLGYGVTHVGNIDDVSAFMFAREAGLAQPRIVPFEGAGDLVTNLVGGNVDVAVLNYGEASSQIQAGDVCAQVVMGDERLTTLPDVPTSADLGIDADFATVRGFAVAEGTPDAVVEQLRTALLEGMQSEEYREYLTSQGLEASSAADAEVWGDQMNNSVAQMREALVDLGYIDG